MPAGAPPPPHPAAPPPRRPARIVILGGGFAGAYCAQALERQLRRAGHRDARILLIDRHNFFVFFPLLVEAGTGSLEPRHAVVSIRAFLKRTQFKMAEVTGVDLQQRVVTACLSETGEIEIEPFDHLVIALGSVTRTPPIPGLAAYGLDLKSLADAVALRDHAIQMLEVADSTDDPDRRRELLHFVVVGGNFTGVEVAGELDAFLNSAARKYSPETRASIRVTLVERSERILAALDGDLSEYAESNLRRRNVDVHLNTSLRAIGPDFAELEGADKSVLRLASRTVIWCAGVAPTPLTLKLPVPRDARGYIECERDLRVKGMANVWGIGDCAVNTDGAGRPYPATAQHAVREGQVLARNLARVLSGKPTLPCDIQSVGSLAALGCRTGVAKVFGIKLSGFLAWWMWRTVYLMKTPGWSRRIRVAIDWTFELMFKRDYVQLGVHRRPIAPAPGDSPAK